MATTVFPVRIVGRGGSAALPDADARLWLDIQRGKETIDLVPGNAAEAMFDLTLVWRSAGEGEVGDLRGPYTHVPRGARFLYLCRDNVGVGGAFGLVSRATLPLPAFDVPTVTRLKAGGVLTATLDLTDERGRPVSGSVRPLHLVWSA